MGIVGIIVLVVIVYLVVRSHESRQQKVLVRERERTEDAYRDLVQHALDATPGGIYEGWEAATRMLMRKGLPFNQAMRIAEEAIRERMGVDPYEYDDTLFSLESRLRETFGQPEPRARLPKGR